MEKTNSGEPSRTAEVSDKIDSDKKAPIPSTSETKNSEKQLPLAEASTLIDSDKQSPTVDAIQTEKPSSNSQEPLTTQPPTAPLIPAASNPVLPDTNINPEVNSTDSTNPVQTASQALTDKQNDSEKVDPLKTEPAAIPKTAASENAAVTTATAAVQTPEKSPNNTDSISENKQPLQTESIVNQSADAESIKTDQTATASISKPPAETESVIAPIASQSPAKTDSLVSNVGEQSPKETNSNVSSAAEQLPTKNKSIITAEINSGTVVLDIPVAQITGELETEQLPTKNESIIAVPEADDTVEHNIPVAEITAELETEQFPTKTDSLAPAEFTAGTIKLDITVAFIAKLETDQTPAITVNSLESDSLISNSNQHIQTDNNSIPALFSTPSETAAVTTQITEAEVETTVAPSTLKSPPEPTSNNYNSNSNPIETVAVLPADSDTEIAPESAEITSGLLASVTEKSALFSDNIADTQPNSTQSTGNFQTNTNPPRNLSITTTANLPIPGTFLVDNQGKVRFDYVFDGGGYEGELGIFSLAGMSAFIPGTPEFIAEASRRVLSNSTDGHIVISDSIEGAKFTGAMPFDGDWDSGEYQGIKTFNMTPGDTFAVMLVPNGTVQSSLQSSYSGNWFPENRPLFSIATANPNDTSYVLQVADVTGTGNTFALEDMSAANSDGDYNDLIFTVLGATGNAPLLDSVINPDREWRNTALGQQLLAEANPPNSDNNPPVVSPTNARTYTELETTISLENLATDAEGDPLTISVQGPVNGTVIFNPLTNKASFKPAPGFSGIASFDFLASDAFGSSTPARVTVNVSDVPLLNLDFVKRNPRLDAGENTELVVLGDFADQKGVVLPDSYLTYTSINPEVAPIDATGKVTGLVNGTSILSASRNNLQAVTAVRVGKLPAPTNDAEFTGALAEINGLNVYPKAVTMTAGMGRSLLVGIENIIQSPDLKFGSVGTRYFPGNSNLLQVNSDGIITAIEEGVTNVTVIHGAAEEVVPVRVSLPAAAGTILGVNGGAVSGSDGSIVMVPPGALAENTAISLTSLTSNDLSLQLPDGLQFAGGFNLDLGDQALKLPAQLAIPAPAGLSPGTEILFMRKGSLPDANNIQNPTWLIQESGVVDASGTIRTNSPPLPGVLDSGEWAMFAFPTLGFLQAPVPTLEQLFTIANVDATLKTSKALSLSTNFGLQSTFLGANAGLIGIAAATGAQFAATILLLAYLAKYLQSGLKVIAIPQVGLPVVTPAGVELDPEGIPSVTATLNIPTLFPADPFAPPVLQSAEFKLENGSPTVVLTGSNFLNNSNDLGGEFEDLTVSFRVGDKTYPGISIPDKNTDLGENRYKIAVKIPITVPVGESSIVVSRKQKKRFGPGTGDYEIVELESEENIRLAPTCVELALVTERTGDKINVINLKDPLSTVETQTSDKLAVAFNIPVGNPNIPSDRPESIAPTNNATRGYVTLRDTGRVSVVDLIALREIDTTPETATVDAISLPSGARPQAIVIDPKDNYAYIADQNRPNIYVLDINPNSATYHTVVQTINVSSPLGLSQLAISSDGRRLFATGSDNNEQTPNRRIYAVNIDPADKPKAEGSNDRKWQQQIGVIPTASETEGIAATPDPKKMVFTNGFASVLTISNGEQIKLQNDGQGFGVLEIESDDPLNFSAKVSYAPLSLGLANDYFDVNEAVAVTVTPDGKYAFVAGRNSRANIGTREGGNIGIIKDPLGPNPQLVAATRPIPDSLTNNLALSSDGKYLIASYPTTNLGGSSYVFDVQEMIKAIENPGNYKLDARDRGVGTVGFATDTERNATQADFARVPIDDINPLVSIAADYEITGGNWINNFEFSVPDGTKRAPIGIGGNPKGLAIASVKNWLELKGPIGNSENDSNPLTPTFEWDIKGKNEECGLPNLDPDKDIHEVNLYVSVFPKEEGLLPGDRWPGLEALTSAQDYNPNRILTAKWSKDTGNWTWNGVSKPGNFEEFTLPPSLMLTAGQKYYWAVEALGENGKQLGTGQPVTGEFKTLLPTVKNSNTFSSVTVLTRGLEPGEPEHSQLIDNQLNGVAKHIYEEGGAVQKYNSATGKWQSVAPEGNDWIFSNAVRSPQYGKPLVLLANWVDEIQPHKLYNSGFAEAAADVLFASMVQLDLEEGGSIGKEGKLYDSTGKLIRNQGAVFNSPLHFVGFGQGAVVNSEIVQRLGTFLPDAGGTNSANRDLQMTTIDPYDYDDNSFSGPFLNIQDPEIKVWNNVTYADNYYQTNGIGNTINGRELSGTNWKSDWNVSLNNLAGFTPDDGEGASHRAALAWYAGTANLNESQFPSENGETIYRRLGDLEQNNIADVTKTWYTPEHTNASFTQGDTKAPWEGIGTGWFDSVLGGGSQLRPYFDGGKKTKNELGDFEDYLKKNRVSVYEDNTYTDRMRGDYAVPTLFNGNFDAVAGRKSAQTIPGWSLFNGSSEDVLQSHLVDWYTIGEEVAKNRANTPGLKDLIGSGYLDAISYDVARPNFALRMGVGGTKKIVHNYFVMPEWGDLRFNLHAPFQNRGGKLKVWLETTPKTDSQGQPIIGTGSHLLKEINLSADPENKLETYASDIDKIGFGRGGFETFHVDSSKLDQFRGQSAKLRFEVEGDTRVYLDDVFFKSSHLEFGNPSEARYSPEEPNNNPYRENLLLEKPQYTASYNRTTKTPNWVSWQVNKSWIGGQRQADDFIADPTLPNGWPQISGSNYENNNGLSLGFNKGHIIPSGDRTRYPKDNIATFLGTNLIPQNADNNLFFSAPNNPAEASAWYNIEQLVTGLAESSKQVYVVAGTYGTNWEPQKKSNALPNDSRYQGLTNSEAFRQQGINIPTWTWKTNLVLEHPSQGVPDVNRNTKIYTFLTPNRAEPSALDWANAGEQGIVHPFYEIGERLQLNRVLSPIKNVTEWRDPNTWLVSLEELENLLKGKNIKLFSNIPGDIRDSLKQNINLPRP
ncbi:DNA/RNA non-specific endonuclease [Tychonema sp. LEGE 06208]|uniref:DNA/RNA non-specific endonuclease n=1 Tax=Tychonema sp. LEGE 06208 TaxID=1828663 RepID=UPI00351CA038